MDVTNLVKVSKKKHLKFNMLMDYCIGKAARDVKEFYLLPVGDKLIQYDAIAVNTIVKNRDGDVSSCDILFEEELNRFNSDYLKYTKQVAATCKTETISFQFHHTQMDGAHAGKFLALMQSEINCF